jgi:chromosome transmission fidelity protein 18
MTYSDLDALSTYETSAAVLQGTQAPTRYAVRQVLDQEMQKIAVLRENTARQARFRAGGTSEHEDCSLDNGGDTKQKGPLLPVIPVKKDFFGRVIKPDPRPLQETDGNSIRRPREDDASGKGEQKVWVTFHEGLNNAVRKPISLDELLRGL